MTPAAKLAAPTVLYVHTNILPKKSLICHISPEAGQQEKQQCVLWLARLSRHYLNYCGLSKSCWKTGGNWGFNCSRKVGEEKRRKTAHMSTLIKKEPLVQPFEGSRFRQSILRRISLSLDQTWATYGPGPRYGPLGFLRLGIKSRVKLLCTRYVSFWPSQLNKKKNFQCFFFTLFKKPVFNEHSCIGRPITGIRWQC